MVVQKNLDDLLVSGRRSKNQWSEALLITMLWKKVTAEGEEQLD